MNYPYKSVKNLKLQNNYQNSCISTTKTKKLILKKKTQVNNRYKLKTLKIIRGNQMKSNNILKNFTVNLTIKKTRKHKLTHK